jgi:predicted Zn finger-like uncharacterized protein
MILTCKNCGQQSNLDDSKVPAGPFQIKCSKCGTAISSKSENSGGVPQSRSGEQVSPAITAYLQRELEKFKREMQELIQSRGNLSGAPLDAGGSKTKQDKKALICDSNEASRAQIAGSLRQMGYKVDNAASLAEATKMIESQFYTIITTDSAFADDKEGGQKLLAMINGQKPAQRRETFVVLLASNIKTTGVDGAFLIGANIAVNKDEIAQLSQLIQGGQESFSSIYSVINNLLSEKNQRS